MTGVDELPADLLHSMTLAEDHQEHELHSGPPQRPPPPGGYIGIGAQIWARSCSTGSEPTARTPQKTNSTRQKPTSPTSHNRTS
jgi:hypothetical protein